MTDQDLEPRTAQAAALAHALQRVARGDRDALREIYEATAGTALGLARQILRDDALAEDVVVETFGHVWQRAAEFDPERGSVRGWIALLARHRALEVLRTRRRRPERSDAESAERSDAAEGPAGSSTVRAAVARETSEHVQRALETLPGEQRAAIEGTFFEGRTQRELATSLGLPLGTLKSRVRLGLARLRTALSGQGAVE